VAYAVSPLEGFLRGTYTGLPLYPGDYVLGQDDGQWGLQRLAADTRLPSFGAYVQLPASTASFLPLDLSQTAVREVRMAPSVDVRYNLMGQKVGAGQRGLVIVNGKKLLIK
jgi:hypothetical protein